MVASVLLHGCSNEHSENQRESQLKKHTIPQCSLIAIVLGFGLMWTATAQAASATWSPTATSSNWVTDVTDTNWSTGLNTFPGATSGVVNQDVATFTNSLTTAI